MNKILLIAFCTSIICSLAGNSWAQANDLVVGFRAALLPCLNLPERPLAQTTIRTVLDKDGALVGEPTVVPQDGVNPDSVFNASVIKAIGKCGPYRSLSPQIDDNGAQITMSFGRSWSQSKAPLPEGLCWLSQTGNSYDEEMWKRFTPPPQRRADLYQLAIDCETLELGRQRGAGRPDTLLIWHISNDEESAPRSSEALLDFFEERFSSLELYMGRDKFAVYVGQFTQRNDGGQNIGASAYTMLAEQLNIATIMFFKDGSIERADNVIQGFVNGMHGN